MKRREYTNPLEDRLNQVTSLDGAECSIHKVETVKIPLEQMSQFYVRVKSEVYLQSGRLIVP